MTELVWVGKGHQGGRAVGHMAEPEHTHTSKVIGGLMPSMYTTFGSVIFLPTRRVRGGRVLVLSTCFLHRAPIYQGCLVHVIGDRGGLSWPLRFHPPPTEKSLATFRRTYSLGEVLTEWTVYLAAPAMTLSTCTCAFFYFIFSWWRYYSVTTRYCISTWWSSLVCVHSVGVW